MKSRSRSLVLALASLCFAAPCAAADEDTGKEGPAQEAPHPSGLSEPERKKQERTLRSRVRKWWNERRKLVKGCPQCHGVGQVRWGRRIVGCPKCDQNKRIVVADTYRYLHYEMKTPAFRAKPGVTEALEERYKLERTGNPWPEMIAKYDLADEMDWASGEHVAVSVTVNRESVPRVQRWVLSEDVDGKPEWFLFDEDGADGPWPGMNLAPGVVEAGGSLEPLSPQERADVEDVLKGVEASWTLRDAHRGRGSVLVLVFAPRAGTSTEVARGTYGSDAIAIVRALFASPQAPWLVVSLVWRHEWRNDLGHVETKVHARSSMAKAKHDKVVWSNLGPDERIALLDWEHERHEGWIPWN